MGFCQTRGQVFEARRQAKGGGDCVEEATATAQSRANCCGYI